MSAQPSTHQSFVRYQKVIDQGKKTWPLSRSGHRLVADEKSLYLIGGYVQSEDKGLSVVGEVWKYDILQQEWELLTFKDNTFRLGASHAVMKVGQYVFIHGGTGSDFGVEIDNNVTCLDLKSFTCTQLPMKAKDNDPHNIPLATYGHTICYAYLNDKPYLYKFAGALGNTYTGNIYQYSFRDGEWRFVRPRNDDVDVPARYRHDAFVWEDKLYVIGGCNVANAFPFWPMPVFDLHAETWKTVTFNGSKPSPLRFQSSAQDRHLIYMLGGVEFDLHRRNRSVYCFDLRTLTSTKLTQQSSPAYFHDVAFVPQMRKLFVFGGVVRVDPVLRTNCLHEFALNDQPLRLDELSWRAFAPLLHMERNLTLQAVVRHTMNVFGQRFHAEQLFQRQNQLEPSVWLVSWASRLAKVAEQALEETASQPDDHMSVSSAESVYFDSDPTVPKPASSGAGVSIEGPEAARSDHGSDSNDSSEEDEAEQAGNGDEADNDDDDDDDMDEEDDYDENMRMPDEQVLRYAIPPGAQRLLHYLFNENDERPGQNRDGDDSASDYESDSSDAASEPYPRFFHLLQHLGIQRASARRPPRRQSTADAAGVSGQVSQYADEQSPVLDSTFILCLLYLLGVPRKFLRRLDSNDQTFTILNKLYSASDFDLDS